MTLEKGKTPVLITGGYGFMGSHFVRHLYNVFEERDIPPNIKDIRPFRRAFFTTLYQLNLPIEILETGVIKKMIYYSI